MATPPRDFPHSLDALLGAQEISVNDVKTKRRAKVNLKDGPNVSIGAVDNEADETTEITITAGDTVSRLYDPLRAAIAAAPVGARLTSRGSVVIGDGGEGDFLIVDSGTFTDDGGTVLTTDGFGTSDTKAAVRIDTGPINPMWFAAAGDDSQIDTIPLQRALAAAATHKRGLFLPQPKTAYRIDDRLLVTAPMHISGALSKINQIGAVKNCFYVTAPNVTFEGLHLYKTFVAGDWVDGTTTQARGINIDTGGDGCTVKNCVIENWGGAGIINAAKGCAFLFNDVIGIGAANGLVDGSNSCTAIYFIASGTGDDGGCRAIGNRIRDVAQGIVGGLNATNLVLSLNEIVNVIGQHGMYIGNGKNMTVVGNTIANCGDNGIKVAFAATATDSGAIAVVGNTIRDVGAGGIVIGDNATNGVRMRGVTCTGNSVYNAAADGIYVNAADGFLIDDNAVRGAEFGIRLDVKCRDGKISDNWIESTTKSGLYAFAESSAYHITVENNKFRNCADGSGSSGMEKSSVALGAGSYMFRNNRVWYRDAVPGTVFSSFVVGAGVVCDAYDNYLVVGTTQPVIDAGATFNRAGENPYSYNSRTDDGSITPLDPRVDARTQVWTAATNPVDVVFGTATAMRGDRFRIIKDYTSGGTFQIGLVSGTRVVAASERCAAEVVYDGTQWRMASFSILNTPSFIEVGTGTFAASGEIRGDKAWSIKAINNAEGATYALLEWGILDTDSVSLGDVNGANTLYLLNGTGKLMAMRFGATINYTFSESALTLLPPKIEFDAAAASPNIRQPAKSSDVAPQSFTIEPQAPYASATGTNRDPSHLIVALAVPTNSGTAEGTLRTKRGSTVTSAIGSYPGAPTVYTCLWLGYNTAAAAGATCSLFGDGAANTYVNVSSGGTVGLAVAGTPKLTVTATITEITPATLQFAQATANPTFRPATTGSAHGTLFTIAGQSSTFTNGNGGFLELVGGTKTGSGIQGGVRIKDGSNTTRFEVDSTGVAWFAGTPVAKQAITGALSTVADAPAKAVLTSIIAALAGATGYNLVTDSTT